MAATPPATAHAVAGRPWPLPPTRAYAPGPQIGRRHPQRMSQHQIDAAVSATTGMMTVPRHTDPPGKAELQTRLGLRLTPNPGPRMLSARTQLR